MKELKVPMVVVAHMVEPVMAAAPMVVVAFMEEVEVLDLTEDPHGILFQK